MSARNAVLFLVLCLALGVLLAAVVETAQAARDDDLSSLKQDLKGSTKQSGSTFHFEWWHAGVAVGSTMVMIAVFKLL